MSHEIVYYDYFSSFGSDLTAPVYCTARVDGFWLECDSFDELINYCLRFIGPEFVLVPLSVPSGSWVGYLDMVEASDMVSGEEYD
ncbi:TPA: hypothetical protein ACV187_004812 [Escherichia coli]